MSGKRLSRKQIIQQLRETEGLFSPDKTIAQVCKMAGITDQSYSRSRKEYGGIRTEQTERLKDLERENAQLKRLLADAEVDKAVLLMAVTPLRARTDRLPPESP